MKAIRITLNTVLALELILVSVLSLSVLAPRLVGYSPYVVLSGSMEPAIGVGSLAYINTGVSGADIKKDDVAAFYIDPNQQQVCTHRAVDVNAQNQMIRTKGDSNELADSDLVSYNQVLGRVDGVIPQLGNLVALAAQYKFTVAAALIATSIAIWAVSIIGSSRKEDEKQQDNEDERRLQYGDKHKDKEVQQSQDRHRMRRTRINACRRRCDCVFA